MGDVTIAELRARLSAYLRRVRSGQSVTVLDRDRPIARIVPYGSEAGDLVIHRPPRELGRPSRYRLPPRLKIDVDIMELLRAERQADR